MSVLVMEKGSKINDDGTALPNEPSGTRRAVVTDVNTKRTKLVQSVGKLIERLGSRFRDGEYVEVEYTDTKSGKPITEWRNLGSVLRVFTKKPMPMDPVMLRTGMRVKLPKNSSWQWATIKAIEEPYAEVEYEDKKLQSQWVSMSTFKTTCHVTSLNQEKPTYSPVAKKLRPRKKPRTIQEKSRRAMNKSPQRDILKKKFKVVVG